MSRKKWKVAKVNKDLAAQVAQEISCDPFAALLGTSRGFDSAEMLSEFFDDEAELSLDPLSIKDMELAAERINRAIENYESICVYGDYDADGVTATAVLFSYLEARGANVTRYVPDRMTEGYGLNIGALDIIKQRGTKLIVTVDTGVSAVSETDYANSLGMDVVITDHHKVGDVLPNAVAVVDPHRPDCPTKFKELSGAGVAFKLVCACEGGSYDMLLEEYGDLVAMGTIGDVVMLTGENRILVRRGIKIINENPRPGVYALAQAAGAGEKYLSSVSVAFTICPRLNAAGRMGSAEKAIELLLCDDDERANDLAVEINEMNIQRQKIENEIFINAMAQYEASTEMQKDKIIVVDGEGWHPGVIGIVAAKITEKTGKPSVVISHEGDKAKGSCRSVDGFSIYDAIESVSDCLEHFGGHTLAAGLGLKTSRIEEFRGRINEYARSIEMPYPVRKIDCKLQIGSISFDLLKSMAMLEPFGAGNPQPCFGLFGVKIDDVIPLSEGKHVRMLISKSTTRTGVVCFGMPFASFPYEKGDIVDLAVNLDKNTFNGESRISVMVRDIRPSSSDDDKVLSGMRCFESFMRGENLTGEQVQRLLPDRPLQVEVFKNIKSKTLKCKNIEKLCSRIGDDGENYAKIAAVVETMLEMGILVCDGEKNVSVPSNPPKVNLDDSAIMKKIKSMI